jgi:hypothetical protein
LQGITQSQPDSLQEISGEQLLKLQKGNDLWALVVFSPVHDTTQQHEQYVANGIPPQVQEVIQEFENIFQLPNELPPTRAFDHAIHLSPNTTPINCRPYRCSLQQKDEIESQVAKKLKSGLVVPSISPFASHVLLVKKMDESWRFCVDYMKLNPAAIKNKFPMPVIDEVAGASYFTKLDLNSGFHQIRMHPEDEHKTAF